MPYHVRHRERIRELLREWRLPDEVLVDVYLALADDRLGVDPPRTLLRMREPFDGMVYSFTVQEPQRAVCYHTFLFHVLYGADETTLWVIDGSYIRTDNL